MFNKQKGFLASFTFYLGLLIGGYFLLILISVLFNFGVLMARSYGAPVASTSPVIRAVVYILFYLILIFIGYILLTLFPTVRLTRDGIEYRSLIFLRKIKWEEMVGILDTRWPKGGKALVFFRKPDNIINYILDSAIRLYPNQTYGVLAGVHEPIIILSQTLEHREAILQEIEAKIQQHGRQDELVRNLPDRKK